MINEEKIIQKLYSNPGGDPIDESVIDSLLDTGAFGGIETNARTEGNQEFARELNETRRGLAAGMRELGFSRDSAQKFASIVKEYWEKPRDEKAAIAAYEKAIERLGPNFEETVAAAHGVLKSLSKKAPKFAGFINYTGLQSNEDMLRLLGEIGLQRRKAGGKRK